jgi:hypothetical protein
VAVEIHEPFAVAGFAQAVGEFGDDPIRGDAEQAGVAAECHGALVQRVGAVEDRRKEKRVGGHGLHLQERPCR